MNDLQIINGVECFIDENGMVQLKLENVARGLGFITVAKSGNEVIRKARVEEYIKGFGFSPEVGKEDFIPEPIFYLLSMKANNEVAREFQKKVAYEVLPSIRKHGMYATDELLDNPDLLIKVATALKEERERNRLLTVDNKAKTQIIGELKPKADYTDAILKNKGLVTTTQIAKDYGMSAQEMNDKLHKLDIQYKQSEQWLLYSKYHSLGYTHSETVNITRKDGRPDIKMNTKWTQKGRLFIYETLKKEDIVPVIEREG